MHDFRFRKTNWLKSAGLAALLAVLCPAHAAEKTTYFHFDALGSPVAASDQAGNVVWKEEYRPYGARIKQEPAAGSNTRWYTGHPQDDDTGLTYMGARYYDPIVGRFMATDPKRFDENNPHSFNRYAYANNNPYKFVDPDGEAAFLAPLLWVLGVISAGSTGVDIGSGIYDVASGHKSVGQVASERAPGLALSALPGLGALKLAKPLANAAKGGTYKLRNPMTGQVKRTGRTNDLTRRQREHRRDQNTKDLELEVDRRTDCCNARRGREQIIYDKHPEARAANGGLNKRRPVSPRNPRRREYSDAGRKL